MWLFRKRPSPVIPDDVATARASLRAADAQLRAMERRDQSIHQLGAFLAARREQNHFGESLMITFTRRMP